MSIHCPTCQSENVIFSKKRGAYVCEDCGHVLPEKPVDPMRIFLSYGHDDNEPLVRRIKADLEKRGHDVWFDKNEIRPGDSWRRSITDGILECDRFLSFLSKHSTRDPGVCRDEIAISIGHKDGNIQTILVESESEVQPPVSISHVQWLDMHDWKDGHGAVEVKPNQPVVGDAAWESWYDGNWKEIQRIIESDQSRQFAGEMDKLGTYLKPIKSHTRIKQLLEKGFIGRKWLFDAVETWRNPGYAGLPTGSSPSRLFWIKGDPGVGKSAFAAQLTHTHPAAIIAAQFCEWDKPDHRDARRVVRSLAFQLATRLPDYRRLLLTLPEIAELDRKDPAELFDYLLANPLKTVIGGGRERLLIVIDALDEAGEAGRNPLVEMLARHAPRLPDWLGLIVTSRPESHVELPLQSERPVLIDRTSDKNIADLREYLLHGLAAQLSGRPDAARLLGQILEKSEGVMLYIEGFCEDVRRGYYSLDRPEEFPAGLGGKYAADFRRYFPDLEKFRKDIRSPLRAILAAREPLPVEILQKLFDWEAEDLRDFTRTLGSLFPVTKTADAETIKPCHKSLTDWLVNENTALTYFVSAKEGHIVLAESCWNDFQNDIEKMPVYFLRYAVYHLQAAERNDDARIVWESRRFRERRIAMGMFSVFLSYARGDDEAFVGRLCKDLGKAGILVWFDRESLLSRGVDFHQEIKDALRTEVDRVVYVGGPKAAQSAYVREDWKTALEFDHVFITPILRIGDYDTSVPGELGLLHCEDFRDDRNYDAALGRLIAGLCQPNPKLGGLFAVPYLPPNFLERPELISRLRDALLVDIPKPHAITGEKTRVGIQGMSGIGKSVLAAALARNRSVRKSYPDGIAWIACGQSLTNDDLLARLRDLAHFLGANTTFTSLPHGQGILRESLQSKAVLLVLDDVWQVKDIEAFDILGPRCRMLVTTHNASILHAPHFDIVPVPLFTEAESLQLLADSVSTYDSPVAPRDLPPEAHEVVAECGGLPLALALCGRMVKNRSGDFSLVVKRLRRDDVDWVELAHRWRFI